MRYAQFPSQCMTTMSQVNDSVASSQFKFNDYKISKLGYFRFISHAISPCYAIFLLLTKDKSTCIWTHLYVCVSNMPSEQKKCTAFYHPHGEEDARISVDCGGDHAKMCECLESKYISCLFSLYCLVDSRFLCYVNNPIKMIYGIKLFQKKRPKC